MNKHKLLQDWNIVKEDFHETPNEKIQLIRQGEIWWVGIGENVGVEINGKSEFFSRPVLVFKKLSHYGFMGIPLTSQKHTGSWYTQFIFKNKVETAVLSQARVYSTSRLYSRLGQIPKSDLDTIRKAFLLLYSK